MFFVDLIGRYLTADEDEKILERLRNLSSGTDFFERFVMLIPSLLVFLCSVWQFITSPPPSTDSLSLSLVVSKKAWRRRRSNRLCMGRGDSVADRDDGRLEGRIEMGRENKAMMFPEACLSGL